MKKLNRLVEAAERLVEEVSVKDAASALTKLGAKGVRIKDSNWVSFTYKDCTVEIKAYDEPSSYGINGSGVSKMFVKRDGKTVVSFDRGWDVKPSGADKDTALKLISVFAPANDPADIEHRL